VHPDDIGGGQAAWAQRRWPAASTYEIEFRLRRADGAYRWHLARALPIRDDGRDSRWVGTNTDIEDQKAAAVRWHAERHPGRSPAHRGARPHVAYCRPN
jgi:PAS domain S-box-containing protein